MMQFTKIDINNWTRKEYFDHYSWLDKSGFAEDK